MRIARLCSRSGPRYAVHRHGRWEHIIDPFAVNLIYTGETTAEDKASFLAPVDPSVVVGIAHNHTLNNHPLPIQAWLKSAHTVAGNADPVTAARGRGTVNVEGELAVVIGRTAETLTAENALDHVLGFTCVNDVTNVDQTAVDERNFQAKAGPNYTPLGPWVETAMPAPDLVGIDVLVNGAVKANPERSTCPLPSWNAWST